MGQSGIFSSFLMSCNNGLFLFMTENVLLREEKFQAELLITKMNNILNRMNVCSEKVT